MVGRKHAVGLQLSVRKSELQAGMQPQALASDSSLARDSFEDGSWRDSAHAASCPWARFSPRAYEKARGHGCCFGVQLW